MGPKTEIFLVLSCSCFYAIYWSQVLSRIWRCSWSSADRRCSNYIWVITNFVAYQGATYIRGLTVGILYFTHLFQSPTAMNQWGFNKWMSFADHISKYILLNRNYCIFTILVQISFNYVAKGPVGDKSSLVQVMAWNQTGANSYLNQFPRSLMPYGIARPQGVKCS